MYPSGTRATVELVGPGTKKRRIRQTPRRFSDAAAHTSSVERPKTGALELEPLSVTAARREVHRLHRHLPKLVGGLFASSVHVAGELVGVAVASEPKALATRGKRTVEITRCATDGHKNACSKLYGALCRAAQALGYTKAITFTRLDEPGTSLLAAGFHLDGMTREQSWSRPSRGRGEHKSQCWRWVRHL